MNYSIFHALRVLELELFISEVMLNTFLKTGKKMSQRPMPSTVQMAKDQKVRNTRKFCLFPEHGPFSLFSIEVFPNYPLTLTAIYLCNWQET